MTSPNIYVPPEPDDERDDGPLVLFGAVVLLAPLVGLVIVWLVW